MLDMCLPTLQFVELHSKSVEDATDAGMVCEHHTADLVWSCNVWTLLGQGYLDRGGTPWNEVR